MRPRARKVRARSSSSRRTSHASRVFVAPEAPVRERAGLGGQGVGPRRERLHAIPVAERGVELHQEHHVGKSARRLAQFLADEHRFLEVVALLGEAPLLVRVDAGDRVGAPGESRQTRFEGDRQRLLEVLRNGGLRDGDAVHGDQAERIPGRQA